MINKIRKYDALIIKKISKLHNRTNNRIMAIVTTLGTGGLVWFLLCIPLLFTKNNQDAALSIMLGILIAWLLGEVTIKRIVGRVRPSEQIPEDEQIIKRPKYYSFPSGHSASSFSVVAVSLVRCAPYITIPVIILATLIAFSRLYLRVHYLTDVLAGMFFGLMCGFAAVGLFDSITHNIFGLYLL
ncbi:MAG: phosphatase PAP2 family protein [Ruminococcus sp.]|nr:phosphatase PAP2 family protein [Ruminococcus sp.]